MRQRAHKKHAGQKGATAYQDEPGSSMACY